MLEHLSDGELRMLAASAATHAERDIARRALDDRRAERARRARGASHRPPATTAPEPAPAHHAKPVAAPTQFLLPADWHTQVLAELGPRRPVSLQQCADAVAAVEQRHRENLT